MKKLALGLMCISLLITVVGTTTAKAKPTKPTYLTNEDKLYQFQRPDKAWSKKEPGKFVDYWFVRRDRSTIFIGYRPYIRALEDFDLSATQHEWIEGMEKKYEYTGLKVIEEGRTTIDQHPAFWHVIELRCRGQVTKEKIYLVQGDEFYYRLRLSCPERYFDKHLEEFEQLAKSFKLLPFKAPVITKTPTYLTNRRKRYQFQKLGKVWTKERPDKFNDYRFVHKIDWSTMFIGSRKYPTPPEEFDLSAAQSSWINGMKEKYNWTDLAVIDQNKTTIAEHSAFYTVIEFRRGKTANKEKIYLVKGDKYYYRLRLSCFKPYFDDHLEEFEHLVKSFKLL